MLSDAEFKDKRRKVWLNKTELEKSEYLAELIKQIQTYLCESGLIYGEIEAVLNLALMNMKVFKLTYNYEKGK